MIAQSALRCSWTVLSIGANGSTAGVDVEDALVGLSSPFFAGCFVEVVDEEGEVEVEAGAALAGWIGCFGDSARVLVDENARILEVLEVCGSSCLRNWY